MTNTISNVPRELLADLLQNYYWQLHSANALASYAGGTGADEQPADCAEELRALLSAPSPAGVDGLEVVAWLCEWMGDKCGGFYSGLSKTSLEGLRRSQGEDVLIVSDEPLCRLSDAQAIIDGLRGEVGAQRVKTCAALKARNDAHEERDQQVKRIGELEGLLRESGKTIHKLQAEQPTPARIARYLDAMRAKIDAALSAGKVG